MKVFYYQRRMNRKGMTRLTFRSECGEHDFVCGDELEAKRFISATLMTVSFELQEVADLEEFFAERKAA